MRIRSENFKIQNDCCNMVIYNFENFIKFVDFYETVRDVLRLLNKNFIQKYPGFFKLLSPRCIRRLKLCYFNLKFIPKHLKYFLVPSFIEISQYMKVLVIKDRHIGSAIFNFVILTSMNPMTQKNIEVPSSMKLLLTGEK